MSSKSKEKPLALSSTLQDLALLRVSDVDLSSLLPNSTTANTKLTSDLTEVDESVQQSYEFAREARSALKIHNSGVVDSQGGRLESVRTSLEDALKGLDGNSSS